jgi:hypothetical protein
VRVDLSGGQSRKGARQGAPTEPWAAPPGPTRRSATSYRTRFDRSPPHAPPAVRQGRRSPRSHTTADGASTAVRHRPRRGMHTTQHRMTPGHRNGVLKQIGRRPGRPPGRRRSSVPCDAHGRGHARPCRRGPRRWSGTGGREPRLDPRQEHRRRPCRHHRRRPCRHHRRPRPWS